ncbi:ribonuclease G [Brevirhabdus pacifica]|uniref:Ribonuclease G n=1 Tax=Brevirhabdus pacifica TaxID=1267768 RepID=A0A1U7DKH6_9RHOB|nr:ribonuclease E/G [Brevirhabdus pacifica]APX90490.1 ribonuclease G [Brevirhabdus pacifica]OWU78496.1 ribonuclease G [Loktanella sp. 22II-4b]PJJ85404.1 Rne/Rng family ribonuclease [Brevirhabdus pacifica]
MKGRVVILDRLEGRAAAALMVDGRLEDFLIDPPADAPPAPGAVFRGILDRPLKGQGSMIVRIPGGTAFLRQTKGLRPGDALLVQVTGYAEPGKAAPVAPLPIFKSRNVIVTPGKPGINVARSIRDEELRDRLLLIAHEVVAAVEEDLGPGEQADTDAEAGEGALTARLGLILRSAAAHATEEEIALDIDETVRLALAVSGDAEGPEAELLLDAPDAHHLAWRDWADPLPDQVVEQEGGFELHGVLDALAIDGADHLRLSGGASIYVEPTRALIAVDVNTGGDTSPAAALKANMAAARALPKALRLRGLSGQITIDFAPSPKKDRRQIEQCLRAAFRADPVETALVGWTPLGHFELQRKRERCPVPMEIVG